jgi:hypothetical protein
VIRSRPDLELLKPATKREKPRAKVTIYGTDDASLDEAINVAATIARRLGEPVVIENERGEKLHLVLPCLH